jgi:GT2 family glycosyltransferase
MLPLSMCVLADITIVIPVFSQLRYTRNCLASLIHAGVADAQIIINNGSTDGTVKYL